MKISLPVILFAFGIVSCTEIPPEINPVAGNGGGPGDTLEIDGQLQNVLIEEFTGVRCVNCPAGAAAIERLIEQTRGRLIAVSIHAGFFSKPYAESLYDFRTSDGDNLQSHLGEPIGYPTAVINRKQFEGEGDLQLGQSLWAGYVQQELNKTPPVYIAIDARYDPVSRETRITVQIRVVEDLLSEDVRLSIALTEDGVMDRQLTPGGEQPDYIHNHILRDMITPFDGVLLPAPLITGENISRNFTYVLSENWQSENCSLVVFTHLEGDRKEILQVIGSKLIK